MAKKERSESLFISGPREHIRRLIDWMSQGVYEKEQIIAMALLCAVTGENIFLLGPPGTAKSMVASRLKMVFKNGRSFDFLMSRFSTPDELFGPISISRLKNEDRYERLTAGYLPEADVVFLDEIWKASPSIQNTLLTVINEHVFHNGGRIVPVPMKVLIAASNELPAKDEGLEALWDRFLVRMVSNCIESDASFFKMIKASGSGPKDLPESLYITDSLYLEWQRESCTVELHVSVVNAIKALRKSLAALEKDDGNQLRFYVSDRRWRKAYRLMQTSAYLNGRQQINLSDYLLLVHCFWNDDACIPSVLDAITSSISDAVVRGMNKIDKSLRQMMVPEKPQAQQSAPAHPGAEAADFAEYDYFYYLVENYPAGDTYFSKWDYATLTTLPRDGVRYYDTRRNKTIIHALIAGRRPFDAMSQNASNLVKVKIQRCQNGAIIDGTPYAFRKKKASQPDAPEVVQTYPLYQRVSVIQDTFKKYVSEWEELVATNFANCENIFLSSADHALVNRMIKEVGELIKATGVKLNNVVMMIK